LAWRPSSSWAAVPAVAVAVEEAVVVLPRVAMVEPLQVQQRRRRPGFFFGYKPTRKGISWGYIIYLYILYIYAYYVYIYSIYNMIYT
jgi:hypothetical protein